MPSGTSSQFKKRRRFEPEYDANGKQKGPKVASDGKTYVENGRREEKKPVYVMPGGPEYKLTLGGYIR